MAEPVVRNAADEGQVAAATVREKIGRERELNDLRRILETDYGRRVVWRLLEHGRIFESIWRSSSEIHYLAGMRDFALFVMGETVAANQDALFLMMQEAKASDEKPKKETPKEK